MADWPIGHISRRKPNKIATVQRDVSYAKWPIAHLLPGTTRYTKIPFGHLIPGHKFQANFPFGHHVPGNKYMANFIMPHTKT
ncbi:MAG: hypothetical protein AAFO98_13005 [Pseudomonadota bacterium]